MRPIVITVAVLLCSRASFADDPIEASIREEIAAQAPDAKQVGPFLKGSGEKTDWHVMLEANRCLWIAGAGQGAITKIALYIWAPNAGTFTPRLASVRSPSPRATMTVCTKEAGVYRLQAKAEGEGMYIVGLFAKDAPKQEEVDIGAICDRRAAEAAAGAKRAGELMEGKGSSSGRDDRFDNTVKLEAGSCYWIIGCGEPDKVKAMSLYLWGPNNKRITEAKSDNATPVVGHCALTTGMYKYQVKITGGSGRFNAGLYTAKK